MKKSLSLFSCFVMIFFCGCTVRLTDFTVISTKNANIHADKNDRVEGEDCANLALGLIPVTGTYIPNLKEAIDNAIEKGKVDLLLDGVVYNKVLFIPLILTRSCYVVEGTVANSK